MKHANKLILLLLATLGAGSALAAATADEAKQLGTTLTPWGAEKAGNKDGSIPAYSGGLSKPPASYSASNPGFRPDPFPEDKPLYSIDAKNMERYADKLSEGTMAMMRKYPAFRIDVYPTRRSAAYPQHVVDNTLKNAARCQLESNGDGLNKECRGGIPFPFPKNGYEVMWNKNARWTGSALISDHIPLYVKPNGEIVTVTQQNHYEETGLYNPKNPGYFYLQRAEHLAPARMSGGVDLYFDLVADSERYAWAYQPATRRVRLTPDVAADTPIGPIGGTATYDDANMFAGKMELFDFRLIGKKEMYIPYNAYRLYYPEKGSVCEGEKKLTPNFINPACVRFELHRVWHVQATLKPGKRHIYSKRDLYIDEDAWFGGLNETYDSAGKLYRVIFDGIAPLYEVPAPAVDEAVIHDLISGIYTYINLGPKGVRVVLPLRADQVTPESLNSVILKP